MNKPRSGFCSPVNITRVIDGDTVEVELTRRFNVRLVHENKEGKHALFLDVNRITGWKNF